MIRRGLFRGAGGCLLAGLLISSAGAGPRMDVEVAVEDLASGELVVTMSLHDFGSAPVRLRGVPTYIDNPVAEAEDDAVEVLWIRSGEEDTTARRGEAGHGEPVWDLDPSGPETVVEYRLRADFVPGPMVESYEVLVPFMDEERAWLTGNHVFITPEFGADRMVDLRRDFPVHLRFVLPEDVDLVGPPREVTFANLHELLSLQFGLGDFEVLDAPGAHWDSQLFLMDSGGFTRGERKVLVEAMQTIASSTADLFGGVPYDTMGLLVFRAGGIGGLEGAWAAQAYLPGDLDLTDERDRRGGKFLSVALHEVVHAWLPVSVFPLEDPWVKEGFTSYYGNVLAARAGWLGPSSVDRLFASYEDAVFGEVRLEEVSLGDPRIWYQEYSGENWRRVTYDRGHAVALLLDVHIRGETLNRKSLDDAMPVLFARHRAAGFGRADLLLSIEDATGVDVGEFFDRYVDSTEPPTPREVDRALRRAVRYGAYTAR